MAAGAHQPEIGLDGVSTIEAYPAPALLLAPDGTIVIANDRASFLAEAMEAGDLSQIRSLAARCVESAAPVLGTVSATIKAEKRIFNVTALLTRAAAEPSRVLILAHEITLENNLTQALVESRQRFKDLVNCSSDFAWETDRDGKFCFVSRKGALGHATTALIGLEAGHLFHPDHPVPFESPFTTSQAIEKTEVWLRTNIGEAACLLVSALPVFDGKDGWAGARGVCHDITEARKLDHALAVARDRQHLLNQIVSAMRDVVNPAMTLEVAVDQVARAAQVPYCRLWRFKSREFVVGAAFDNGDADADEVFAAALAHLDKLDEEEACGGAFIETMAGNHRCLMTLSQHHRTINGAICIARETGDGEWSDDDRDLLSGIAAHLGIAMEQIAKQEELERLSRTDPLTGLLNQRHFIDEVKGRIRHQQRSGHKAALLYMDLDNFKQVNDQLGHPSGDDVLRAFAETMHSTIRVLDIGARFGGDEFAIWLECTDQKGAETKAEELLAACQMLQDITEDLDPPLSVSIGIAISDPEKPRSLAKLIESADLAMYEAKKGGKACYAVANP